jgi:DNA primase
MAPRKSAQPLDRSIRYENEYSAVAEEGIIRCVLLDPSLMEEALRAGLHEGEFTSPFLAKAYGILKARCISGADVAPASLLPALDPAEAVRVSAIMQKPESIADGRRAIGDYIEKIRTERVKKGADILEVYSKYKETKGLGG